MLAARVEPEPDRGGADIARYIGIEPDDLVFVAEYCGGGFGSKMPGYPIMAMPALLSKKISRPVMMRISRIEEYASAPRGPSFQGHIKMGFRADGKLLAADLYIVQENGPDIGFGDSAPPATRCRSSISRTRCASAACRCSPTRRCADRSAARARTR